MIKVIAFFGPSSSEKDTLAKILSKRSDVNEIISCTTRPKRDYEKEGIDYYFISTAEFGEKVINGTMLEATSFRDWFYGTPLESLKEDKINIGVFNKQGIECLLSDNRLEIIPVYIACEDKKRLMRSLERETNPDCEEICRRFLADKKDFESIDFEYLTFYNGTTDPWLIEPFLIDHGVLSKIN